MASPWKFLARLMSPQRLQKQEEGAHEGVKETDIDARDPVDGNDLAGQPAEDAPPPANRSAAASVEPSQSDESDGHAAESGVGNSQQRQVNSAQVMAEAGARLADTELKNTAPTAPAKRNRRVKKVDAVAGGAQILTAPQSPTDEMTSLDDEIRQLRVQLAHRLRLQNAQLKKMLERFEH